MIFRVRSFDAAAVNQLGFDIVEQTEQCMKNIVAALPAANATVSDIVRMYISPLADEFPLCWPVLRRHFEQVRPAATMISAGLADRRMKIEIEVTARRSRE